MSKSGEDAMAAWPSALREEFEANRFNPCVGQVLLSETPRVRVWSLSLQPGERLPFHPPLPAPDATRRGGRRREAARAYATAASGRVDGGALSISRLTASLSTLTSPIALRARSAAAAAFS